MLNESKGNITCYLCGKKIKKINGTHKYCLDCKPLAAKIRARKSYNKHKIKRRKEALEYRRKNIDRYKLRDKLYANIPKKRYYIYKHSAKNKKINFELTFEEFMKFWQAICFYCGTKIETIGIDRVNNKIGYILSNLVPCCSDCNAMKSNKSQSDFLLLCKKIVEYQKKKVADVIK